MKLVLLGATGGIGRELMSQSLERGHQVTALVRSPEALSQFGGRIALFQGDLLNGEDLASAIEGHDAVLSGFGPRLPLAKADHGLLARFAQALMPAMRQAGVSRLLVVSTAFLFKDSLLPPAYLVGRLFFPSIVSDAAVMESILQKSGLAWTIVRPPRLTGKPRSGKYRVREDHLPRLGFTVSRADVAHFMLNEVEHSAHVSKIVGVCN